MENLFMGSHLLTSQTVWNINGDNTEVDIEYADFQEWSMLSDFHDWGMSSAGDCINSDGLQSGVNDASVTEPSSPIQSTLQDPQNVNNDVHKLEPDVNDVSVVASSVLILPTHQHLQNETKDVHKEEPDVNDISVFQPSVLILPTHHDLQNENKNVFKLDNAVDNTKAARTIMGPPTELGSKMSIGLKDLEPHFGSSLADAAGKLCVSKSTLKRRCRKYGVERWPYSKRNRSKQARPNSGNVNSFQINGHLTYRITNRILKIKAEYRDDIVKFPFSISSGLVDLKKKVCERLGIDFPIKLKCKDDDGDLVLIACDKTLDEQFDKISGRELEVTSCLFSYKQIGYILNIRELNLTSESTCFG